MKNIQIILNAILAKDRFEYILVDKAYKIYDMSPGVKKYFKETVRKNQDVKEILPELVGVERDIEKIFNDHTITYELESVYKNNYYVNLCVEYYDKDILLVLLHNITDKTVSQQKLLQYSNESILLNNTLQKILDSQNALVFVANNKEITYANKKFMHYFSVKKLSNLNESDIKIYKYLDESLDGYDALFEKVNSKEEYIVINNDTFILQASLIESTHKLFTLTNVTELTQNMQLDTLTGVYKKSYFNACLEKNIRNNEESIVVVIDIDDFKIVNDTFGHQAGDDVLKEFTMLLQNNIRDNDILARWGGEEFLLLLKHTKKEHALNKIEALRKLIENHTFKHIKHMTASFGLAKVEEDDTLHSVLHRADIALYEAKKSGKNCLKFKKK